MKRKRFTEEQIIVVLREHEAGAKPADLARKHGISEAALYNWKAKYGGMDVSDAKRLKALEDENAKLKKLLADQMLEASALKELLAKKMVGLAAKRQTVAHLKTALGLSERRACSIVNADRKMVRYRSRRPPDTELRHRLRALANERRRFTIRRDRIPRWTTRHRQRSPGSSPQPALTLSQTMAPRQRRLLTTRHTA